MLYSKNKKKLRGSIETAFRAFGIGVASLMGLFATLIGLDDLYQENPIYLLVFILSVMVIIATNSSKS